MKKVFGGLLLANKEKSPLAETLETIYEDFIKEKNIGRKFLEGVPLKLSYTKVEIAGFSGVNLNRVKERIRNKGFRRVGFEGIKGLYCYKDVLPYIADCRERAKIKPAKFAHVGTSSY